MVMNKQTSAKLYKKKPIVIEAFEVPDISKQTFLENNVLYNWLDQSDRPIIYNANGSIDIYTLEGIMEACIGDFIIKGVNGEFYPCKPDIFEKTYEELEN